MRFSHERILFIDLLSPEKGFPHNAQQLLSLVGSHLVSMEKLGSPDCESFLRIPYNQIGVITDFDFPLLLPHSRKFRRPLAHPPGDVAYRKPAFRSFRPDDRQSELQRRYSAPCSLKISCFKTFERRIRRGMIGNDEVDRALPQPVPNPFTVVPPPDRRRAFEPGVAIRNFFRREIKIMRACFGCKAEARAPGLLQLRDGVG